MTTEVPKDRAQRADEFAAEYGIGEKWLRKWFELNLRAAMAYEEGAALDCINTCIVQLKRKRFPDFVVSYLIEALSKIKDGADANVAFKLRRPKGRMRTAHGWLRLFSLGRAVAEFRQGGAPMTLHSSKESAFAKAARQHHVSEEKARQGWRVYREALGNKPFELHGSTDDDELGEIRHKVTYDPKRPWAWLPGSYRVSGGLERGEAIMLPEDRRLPLALVRGGLKK